MTFWLTKANVIGLLVMWCGVREWVNSGRKVSLVFLDSSLTLLLGALPCQAAGTALGAHPSPCERLAGAGVDVPLPTCGSTSDKLSAGETLDKWFLPRAVLAYKRLLWYVSNCFSLPFPWQKYRVVCFVKNRQKLWTETHKTVDDPAGVLLKLLRLGAVRTGAVVHLLPLKDSNLSTPSSRAFCSTKSEYPVFTHL